MPPPYRVCAGPAALSSVYDSPRGRAHAGGQPNAAADSATPASLAPAIKSSPSVATAPPGIDSTSVSDITETGATLEAQIDPEGLETEYEAWLDCSPPPATGLPVRLLVRGHQLSRRHRADGRRQSKHWPRGPGMDPCGGSGPHLEAASPERKAPSQTPRPPRQTPQARQPSETHRPQAPARPARRSSYWR